MTDQEKEFLLGPELKAKLENLDQVCEEVLNRATSMKEEFEELLLRLEKMRDER